MTASTRRRFFALALVCAAFALVGCKKKRVETTACAATAAAGDAFTCSLDAWPERDYDLLVPDAYAGEPVPVLLVFHGGGGNRGDALATTCPNGAVDDPRCLHARALARGWVVIAPDGTPDATLGTLRTWNAGGGVDDWRCASGRACEEDVDDMAYVDALLADAGARVAIDPARVFATGLSNGGAISHRLACERAETFTGIVAVGGAMQLTVETQCTPARPVAVLQIHGTADTCWNYAGGVPTCAGGITGQAGKSHVPVQRTLDEWAAILACAGAPTETALPDADPADDTTTAAIAWSGCAAPLEHWRVDGGGHVWPDGNQYLPVATIGPVPRDFGNDVVLDWLDAIPRR